MNEQLHISQLPDGRYANVLGKAGDWQIFITTLRYDHPMMIVDCGKRIAEGVPSLAMCESILETLYEVKS
jgi:hypothetical protein